MGTGTFPSVAGMSVHDTGDGKDRRTVVRFTDCKISVTDDAGVDARIAQKLYTYPEGLIMFGGAVINLAVTKDATGVNADWDGDVGLGSVAAASGATLATTEQDYVPTTATPQAVAGATTAKAISTATEAPKLLDGTATAKDVYLNILIDDADQDVTTTPTKLILNGEVSWNWEFVGDK